jgi:hypothetical protein
LHFTLKGKGDVKGIRKEREDIGKGTREKTEAMSPS